MEQRRRGSWLKARVNFIFMVALLLFGRAVWAQVRYSVSEEQKEGTLVGNIAKDLAIDQRTLKDRGFRIVSTAADSLFKVNQNDGVLYVSGNLDREKVCEKSSPCLIDLKIALENPLEIHYATVEIVDVNDNAPLFSEKETVLEIWESALPGTRFQLPAARDPDSGSNSIQAYKLSQSDHFRLEVKDRGEVGKFPILVLQKSIDREAVQSMKLSLTAADGGKPAKSGTMEITVYVLDVNDNMPIFTKDVYSVMLNENAPIGATVIRLNATDLDKGPNGEVIYAFANNVDSKLLKLFDIDSITGEITVKGNIDFEATSMYEIDIQASDKGTIPHTTDKSVTIKIVDVNDNIPEIEVASFSNTISEDSRPGTTVALISVSDLDSGLNGKSLFSVSASDRDANENAMITYEILRESAEEHKYASFVNINSENGWIYALKSFDFETLKTFQFHVLATDSGTPPLSSNVTVNVFILDQNDNVPVILYPVSSNGSAEGVEEIPRNVNAGHLVTKVRAYDADIGYNGWLLFSLQEVSDHSLFGLDRYTGQIRTLRSFTETDEAQHKLVILVKDNGNVSLSATATVIIKVVEPKEAFAASDVKHAVKDEEDSDVTFYLIITLGSVSVLFVISIIVLIVMQCSKSTDYSSKYLQDTNYDGTLCHSIQYRSGDKRYMLVGPRMSIGSTLAPGSNRNTLVVPDRRRRSSGEVRLSKNVKSQ
ncbi:hypothetical protein MHYP_G00175720 [Metynnis hypsauchen]